MNRRALLVSLGSVTLAGCTTDGGPADGATRTESESTTGASSPEPTTAEPDPPNVGVPPGEASGPPWDDDVKRVVSWTEATEETPVRLTPARSRGSLPTASFEFTLRNDADSRFAFNDYGWSVWKRTGGEWFRVAPQQWPEPLRYLAPEEAHTWTLTVDNSRLDGVPASEASGKSSGSERSERTDGNPLSPAQGRRSVTLVGLGGGTYAFTIDGWFASENYENGLGFAARFELDGDPVELAPTNDVTARRDGDTVVVTADAESGDDSQTAAFVVRRVDGESGEGGDDGDVRRIIAEQALRDWNLRNTFPFFEDGVETVRLEGRSESAPPFGVAETGEIEYDGERYRITSEEADTADTETE